MAVETAADRAVFFDTDDFGSEGTYTLDGGGSTTISGIFDNGYALEETGGFGVAGTNPTFQCRTADLPSGARRGDTLTLDAQDYIVQVVQPDGTGVTTLDLEEVE